MLGGGCQVRVVSENMIGRMENLRTLISGFLANEMFFGHDVPFLNYSDRLPHPSDKSFLLFAERLSSLARYSSGEHLSNIYETTATAHAQTCQNMPGYDLSNIYEETEIKHVSRPPEARSKVCDSNGACSNMPKRVRIRPVKHMRGNRKQTCQ